MKYLILLAIALATALTFPSTAADWIHLPPKDGTANGKKIVFVTGDDEYKSETSMPMMAHILAERHGFDCKVLFAINRSRKVIDTNQRDHIPGLEALKDADLMVIYTRFRTLVDEEMRMIEAYLKTGKSVIGIRTATHAFDFSKKPDSPFAKYGYNYKGEDYPGGFGQQVLGQTWVNHWGGHGRQASRGRFAPGKSGHSIFRGIADGEIWGPTDVYQTTLPQPDGCEALLLGEVCESMDPTSGPVSGRKNEPMMPIAWTYRRDVGAKGRIFVSTIGGAMSGLDDWANEGMRRMFVNACYWTLKMEDQIPAKADVTPVLQPNPFRRGIKPEDALKQGLAALAAKDSTILFYGNSMIERLLEHGEMEARLQIAMADSGLKIRSLAWTGDEVGNRLRLEGYAKHMKNLLAAWPANTIVLGYGLNEAFAGAEGLDDFKKHYASHLSQLSRIHPGARFILLSPIAGEFPDEKRQANVALYRQAIAELAKEHKAGFIDLHSLTASSSEKLTINGIHLNDTGNRLIAKKISDALLAERGQKSLTMIRDAHLREVARAAAAKHDRVAELVRPKNAVVYFGVRARPDEYAAEMPRYHEMIRLTEEVVHQMAKDSSLAFSKVEEPSLPPMAEGKGRDDGDRTGIIKTVAESMAEFTVADGFAVNLFASEEQFPELRNPVQIAFDARGRLWVVTMPSFPHTVPGLTPPDKIIILEDTDRDGQADKLTTFAEGLDALDGVAFHRDGVIISEQPRLWLMQDTDGDDRADTRRELLRGVDVTDSHHGGMVATDPFGDVIFSDGVFHRSQLETPFGVHRGIDATTYRLDPITGRINTEWQHTTPNPWNVTFDRWGNTFQIYGDGHVYDGSSLIWTPLGAYHPFRYAHVCSYGKGSGVASISSPNFPDHYQQGIASASLLGRYTVTLTTLNRDEGMILERSHETILSSPNAAFRPADVEFGMDGALYVSDFCSPIIGHAQHPMRDPHWDHDFGRIWRVVHTKKPIVKDWPDIEGASEKELCGLLVHPQDLVRHHARIEIRKHGEVGLKAVDEWLATLDRESPLYEQAALETIFVCEGLGKTRPTLVQRLLNSKSPMYRSAAIQALRLQADRIIDASEMLGTMVNDPHPRVQIEVIDAVAHLRPDHPGIESCLALLKPLNKHVQNSLSYIDLGIEPAKGRSVPVLEVAPLAQLKQWLWLGEQGESAPVEYQVGRDNLPGVGLFRTFIHSDESQSAIVGINHKSLEIRLNDVMVFQQDSFWSGDQQVNVELTSGLNVLEIKLLKGRRAGRSMPPVSLYDPVGQALSGAKYVNDRDRLRTAKAEHDKLIAERGNVVRVQAAAGLQFSPKNLRVIAGSKVRLVFNNPDVMIHNWVLLKPGSVNEVGALADKIAAQADAYQKGYVPDSDKILVASKLLSPKETQEIVFQAPANPGDYPYLCTFPGHWRIMQGVLTVIPKPTPSQQPSTKNQEPGTTLVTSEGVLIEHASSQDAFKTLKPSATKGAKVTVNKKTSNEPVATLTDGKLAQNYGPIFGNGITDGTYKMDLGSAKSVAAVTSWSFNMGSRRRGQKVAVYGSGAAADPGWDLKKFTRLGAIDTTKDTKANFTAASLRTKDGKPLGKFRWIVWSVSPVSDAGGGENTPFQELAVEITKAKAPAAVTKSLKLPAVLGQFVRIELPGEARVLSLAEVMVFEKGKNVALNRTATQSTVAHDGAAARAVDGDINGDYHKGSVTHTVPNGTNPWWEVDLGRMVDVEELAVHNRDSLGGRLDRFTLKVLDAERKVVFSKTNIRQTATITFLRSGVKSSQTKKATAKPDVANTATIPALPDGHAFPGTKTDFRGYDRYDRIKTSAGHFSIVCPKEPAPGKPWLWRSLFWEAIKKVSDADLKLVDEGYHVVLAHGDVAGHPKGNANISAAYEYLTQNHGFAKTCSMSSMSRGTLSLFRWATENPEKVNSIYVDNGVCNVLSWPAGKLVPGNKSIANGAPGSWADFKKKFGYQTDAEALKTKESPIDLLEPLSKAGVPILMVCGNQDTAVPYEENDAVMEKRYQALGGEIKVIVENKGHSHGMKDPTPVLEFIRKHTAAARKKASVKVTGKTYVIDSQEDWQRAAGTRANLEFKDGMATPTAKKSTFTSVFITSEKKRSAKSLTIDQSPVWRNWEPIPNLGPSNLGDAPVMLTLGPGNYWMFGRYGGRKKQGFKSEPAKLEGYDVPLRTTPFPNQYDAPGGLKRSRGGYHAWQSKDMVTWVHHGPVTEAFSSWVTTAEYADGKLYIYYDYPNDQDPHLYIDDNLFDGKPGKNMGMAFNDPSHGSDCAFIRDLEGNFHVIYEDWSPIDASTHSWDSPLAGHAVSSDGIGNFKILSPAVDVRTKPTGKFAEYPHPHWHATDPKKYPGKAAPADVPQHRIKKGQVRAFAKYEIHEPEQNAFGDWAAISIGGRYYLFADYHPANDKIRVGWFTSPSLDQQFTFCGEIGKGHPDPDIAFAEGKFYLATQMSKDYVSPGPWVETVEARVGVDTNKDGSINQWTDWQQVKESYDYTPGFSKQVAKTPAKMDLSELPKGYGFQFELKISDSTNNDFKPILDKVALTFGNK